MSGEYFLEWSGKAQTTGTAHRTHRRFWQAALLVLPATAACGQATPGNAQSAEPPFTIQEVAKFSTPWAIDFLPGSGVALTRQGAGDREGRQVVAGRYRDRRQAGSGRGSGGPCRGAGRAGRCRGASGLCRQPARLSELRRARRGRKRRGARVRAIDPGQWRATDRGLQDHLAAGAQSLGQRPFQPPHRLRARWPALPHLGRTAEIHPRTGYERQSRQGASPDRRGASRAGQSVGRAGRGGGAILDRSATATCSGSPSRPMAGCGRARWARKAATRSI